MKRSMYIIAGLLVLSVCLNLYALDKIQDLAAIIEDTRNQVSSLDTYISSQIASVRNTVDRIRDEERWMSPIAITPGEPSGTTLPVALTWQLKDCPVDAQVNLFMRKPGEAGFTAYSAESTGGGGFRANIEHRVQPEPLITVAFSRPLKGPAPAKESMVTESSDAYLTGRYEYYVTMTDGHQMRSTEASSLSISQTAGSLVAPVSVEIDVQDSRSYTLSVHETPKPEPYYYELKGVSLKIVKGTAVEVTPLEMQGTTPGETAAGRKDIPVFQGIFKSDGAPAEVLLVFDYGNGIVSEVPVKYLMDPGVFF